MISVICDAWSAIMIYIISTSRLCRVRCEFYFKCWYDNSENNYIIVYKQTIGCARCRQPTSLVRTASNLRIGASEAMHRWLETFGALLKQHCIVLIRTSQLCKVRRLVWKKGAISLLYWCCFRMTVSLTTNFHKNEYARKPDVISIAACCLLHSIRYAHVIIRRNN